MRPTSLSFGGGQLGNIADITWSNWGGPTARGTGSAMHWDGQSVIAEAPQAPVTITATDIGTCGGKRAYTTVTWWFDQDGPSHADVENVCN